MTTAISKASGTMLSRLEAAKTALAEAKTFDELKDLRDQAQAMAHYLKQRDYSLDAQQDAAEIKLRAERRLGLMLQETVNHNGSKGSGRPAKNRGCIAKPLTSIPDGISKLQSHRWQKVASLPADEFEEHIATARKSGLEITTAAATKLAKKSEALDAFRNGTHKGCTVDDLAKLAGEQFGCIYADPPWKYSNQATRASTDNHYLTMTVDEICSLPIRELAADKSHCHLWTTNAFLFESKRVLEAWGFEYKSVFLWVKPQMGIGNYWRVSHEFLILGARGNCPFLDRGQMSWLQADRSMHSRKPEAVRSAVELVSPGPRLELFGTQVIDGWTVWGNQIHRGMFDEDIKHL